LISSRRYDQVIDIGSAEGYYAIGLARLLGVKVQAFEPETKERSLSESMAQLNGVENLLQLKRFFTESDIDNLKNQRALVICDCEGFEKEIFTVASVPKTLNWDLIIELHGETANLLPALKWPHVCHLFEAQPRKGNYPELVGIGPCENLLSEFRCHHQRWLWCDSKHIDSPDSSLHSHLTASRS